MSVMLTVRPVNGQPIVILDVSGRLTLAGGAGEFHDKILDLLTKGWKNIILNLAECSYIDCSGTAELVQAFTTVVNRGGQLKLLNITKRLKDLLQITKLYTVFDIHHDEAPAVRSFRGWAP